MVKTKRNELNRILNNNNITNIIYKSINKNNQKTFKKEINNNLNSNIFDNKNKLQNNSIQNKKIKNSLEKNIINKNEVKTEECCNIINNNKVIFSDTNKNNNIEIQDKEENKKRLDYGHRQRLRENIIQNYNNITKEKVFEYLMCLAIPMKDTRLIAKTILEKMDNNFLEIFNKSPEFLKNTLNLSDTIVASILTVSKIMSFCNVDELTKTVKIDSRSKYIKFFQKEIGSKDTEHISILFLSSSQKLIEKRIFDDNNSSKIGFNIPEIITIALNNNAKFIILAHNHPSGEVKPSLNDINLTNIFIEAIDKLDKFELLDHVIVSKNRYYSFFEHGLIKTKNKY